MRWIIFVIIYLILDIYAYQAFKTVTRQSWIYFIYLALSLGVLGYLLYQFNVPEKQGLTGARSYAIGFFLAFFAPKLILFFLLFGEDLVRLVVSGFQKLAHTKTEYSLPSRRKFVSQVALGIAAIPFASLLYGMYRGRYNYKVLKYVLHFDDLPDAFDGYRITQISDVHSGSFDNPEKISYGIALINEQKSDAVMFTGDLVNNTASEMDPWKEVFSGISAPDGVYSVLGNHDYGDYVHWESAAAKKANLEALKAVHREMGWNLLLDEHKKITRGSDTIAIVGVENWGAGFKQVGDLGKAASGLSAGEFKILLSHDPSHWEQKVKKDEKKFQLTLSGHTHGMQFGIEIPGWFKWSPAQYRYEHWAGIYNEAGRFLNVNRGFGFLAYPGRVGIWPEVSVIELRKGPKPA
ncbi:metallophosphoesterase family protein [Salinimicrobium tongyeongense]|uniref:Metallophosphoesterase family protein n=1 Tax=Salinimicrobium tongyeongense TaxID=2809707 RepID=A0ABY6NMG8_9FLAO|nr:metallophosphoesterase [Salinimicrobium tongyeongense]UZH54090.1 metallophosphoesterase family protein [Salinimicrobium tongyeongense]